MKNLKILFSLIFIALQTFAFAQKTKVKKQVYFEGPPLTKEELLRKNPVYKIISKDEIPVAFTWELAADTLLVKNTIYSETIILNCAERDCDRGSITTNYSNENFQMEKKVQLDKRENIIKGPITSYATNDAYDFNIVNDVITLKDPKSKKSKILKVTFSNNGKNIKWLEDIKTKRIYVPSHSFTGNLGM